jgi:hypothetical protein
MTTELLDAPKTESSVMAKYGIAKAEIQKTVDKSKLVTVTGPDDAKGMALARENRLSLQKMRTTIEAKRKELKADALAYGKKVDSVAKELTAIITPEETRLKELEETAAREAERLAEVEKQAREVENKRRCDVLAKINVMVPMIELQFMDAPAFNAFYDEKKTAFDAAEKAKAEEEAARKAEAERLAKVAEEQATQAAEIARQQAELAKKQAEQQAEFDRQRAEIEARQKAIEDAENAERKKRLAFRAACLSAINSDAQASEMMQLTDAEFEQHLVVMRLDYEKAKEQEARAEAFRKEQEAKEEAERIATAAKEQADRIERERLAEIARKEAEAKDAADEAARIAALAPDREKIDAYIVALSDIPLPVLSSPEAMEQFNQLGVDFIERLRDLMVRLEKGTL